MNFSTDISHQYRLYTTDGVLVESASDMDDFTKLNGFVRKPSASELINYPDIAFMVVPNAGKNPEFYVTHKSRYTGVPDDVTGAASEPVTNVQFVGDSATFESLPDIRKLAGQVSMQFASSASRRPVASDFTDFAMQVLAIVYKNSKEK